jgi:hypothetical protein
VSVNVSLPAGACAPIVQLRLVPSGVHELDVDETLTVARIVEPSATVADCADAAGPEGTVMTNDALFALDVGLAVGFAVGVGVDAGAAVAAGAGFEPPPLHPGSAVAMRPSARPSDFLCITFPPPPR